MKFRLISRFGDGLALAWTIQQAGHDVDCYLTEPASPRLYQGLIRRVDRWNKDLTPETVVLFDMVGMGKIAESIRATGHPVYGAGALNDQLELDRPFARHLAKAVGILVPPTETYEDYAEAVAEIRKQEGGWVFRPVTTSPAPFTVVASTSREMRIMLEHFGRSGQAAPFTLQPLTPGVEVSIGCWYVKGQPVPATISSTLESARFLAGGLGPRTGGMGCVSWLWRNPRNKLYRMTHEKLHPFLSRYDYDGPLSVRVIIAESDRRPVFLDCTARFGNAIHALSEDMGADLAEVLAGAASGKPVDLKPTYEWCGGLRITTPPFPYRIGETFAGKPVAGGGFAGGGHFWRLDVFESDGRLLTAGGDGVVGDLTGRAKTLEKLAADLYGTAEKLIVPDKQYRTDIIDRARRDIERLTEWKYIKPVKGKAHAHT